jgi:DHA1 family tetracycline resistance protein-like MFS transporter
VLFAARIFDGITGGNIVVAQAYVTDVTSREKRAQALGLIAAMFGLGFFIGPAAGGLLVGLGPRVPYFIAAGAAGVVVLMTAFTLHESMTAQQREALRANAVQLSFRTALAIRPLVLALIIGFIAAFSLGLIIATFALFGDAVLFESNAELGVGLLLALVGLSQIVTQLAILPRALVRFGEDRLIVVGIAIRSLGLLAYAVTVSPVVAAVGGAVLAAGAGLTLPPVQSIATKTVDDSKRGGVLGVFQSVSSLAVIVSTAVAGVLFALYPHLPNQVAFGASVLSIVPALALARWVHKSAVTAS